MNTATYLSHSCQTCAVLGILRDCYAVVLESESDTPLSTSLAHVKSFTSNKLENSLNFSD